MGISDRGILADPNAAKAIQLAIHSPFSVRFIRGNNFEHALQGESTGHKTSNDVKS
jgi:hypothetical protein